MRLRRILLNLLLCLLALTPATLLSQTAPQPPPPTQVSKTGPAYTLPPDVLAKAVAYSRARTTLGFVGTGWSILQLLLLLTLGVVYRMRNVAVNLSKNRWTQCGIFLLQLLILTSLLDLPLGLFGHHLAVAYGQSVQSWPSWFGDQAKAFALTYGIGYMLVMALFWTIRHFPRRWWVVFWAVAMVFALVGIFASPYIIDPLFNKFEPLSASNPALVDRLEQVVHRANVTIPPQRMFLMKASAKVTGLNAYVTGFGASKRVVVWDTSIAKATPDQIQFIFGHELGHYVLNHIPLAIAFTAVLLLISFYLGYLGVQWLIARYGRTWRVPTQLDWGALVIIVMVLSIISFLTEPVSNAFSRWEEHQADIFGQEAIHTLVPDPATTAQSAFQVLGETSLDDPDPNPFVVFWTYSHPSIPARATFARDYNPWAPGQTPRYFKK